MPEGAANEMKQFLEDTKGNIKGYAPAGGGWYKEIPGESGKIPAITR